jgi:rare lipoprotein A
MKKHLSPFPHGGIRAVPATVFLLLSGSAVLAETGHASFYGRELAGRRTASGEVFRPDGMTAAHRSLPFGSRVKVTNNSNGKAVVVRITDRGPFVRGRIIDVSQGAARALGFVGQGTARVTIERVGARAVTEAPAPVAAPVSAPTPAPSTANAEPERPDALPDTELVRNPEGNGN